MSFKYRPYQETAMNGIDASFERVNNTLLVMGTGLGKTVVFTGQIEKRLNAGTVSDRNPAVVLCDREELITQAARSIQRIDDMLRIGIERAESRAPATSQVIVASVATVGKKNKRFTDIHPGLVICDEAHLVAAPTWINALKKLGCGDDGDVKMMGCTATPFRGDNQAIHSRAGAIFQEVAFDYPMLPGVMDGWLCDPKGFGVQTGVDLSGIGTSGGDFNEKQLAKAVDREDRTKAAFDTWEQHAKDRRTLVFCVGGKDDAGRSCAHAYHAAAVWEMYGYKVGVVDGTMDREGERKRIFEAHKRGEIQLLFNVGIATTGYDDPNIGCVIHLRPTKSPVFFAQSTGRGTRPLPGVVDPWEFVQERLSAIASSRKPNLIVIDAVDNYKENGSIASLAGMVGLPPRLNLEGATLTEAHRLIQEVKRKGAGTLLAKVVNDAIKAPKNLREVRALIEQVDILGSSEPNAEIKQASKFAWLEQPGSGYALSIGDGRSVSVTQDALGVWQAQFLGKVKTGSMLRLSDSLSESLRTCDAKITEAYPDAVKIAKSDSRWRSAGASPKQVEYLVKYLNIDPKIAKKMTGAQASGTITQSKLRRSQGQNQEVVSAR